MQCKQSAMCMGYNRLPLYLRRMNTSTLVPQNIISILVFRANSAFYPFTFVPYTSIKKPVDFDPPGKNCCWHGICINCRFQVVYRSFLLRANQLIQSDYWCHSGSQNKQSSFHFKTGRGKSNMLLRSTGMQWNPPTWGQVPFQNTE
jgi:hypothetical protein